MNSKYQHFIGRLLCGSWWKIPIFLMAGYAWFGTPLLILRNASSNLTAWFGASLFLVALIILVLSLKKSYTLKLDKLLQNIRLPGVWIIIIFGLFIRLIWVMAFAAEPASDGQTYIELSLSLLNKGVFETGGTRAYWPPGYPFFLMPWISVLPIAYAITTSQLTLFVTGCLGCYRLAYKLNGEQAARVSALLFAIWPNLITQSGIPAKEILVIALLPWAFLLTLKYQPQSSFSAGILFGSLTLVQPSLQLLIPGAAILTFLQKGLPSAKNSALLILGAILIISPWTIRNYLVFKKFVLISTNGGDVLYRANNPFANGGYTLTGAIDLSNYSEIDKDLESKKLAKQWIKENKLDFAGLIIEKQIQFMGDDSVGIYETLKRGKASNNESMYAVFKMIANAWWLLVWLWMALFAHNNWKPYSSERLLLWGWLYLLLIHSLFESAGKYHVPMLWVLCIVLGSMVTTNATPSLANKNKAR